MWPQTLVANCNMHKHAQLRCWYVNMNDLSNKINSVIYSPFICSRTVRLSRLQKMKFWRILETKKLLVARAGRYTGSYRIPVFIFLTIWIFKIPQYRCHLNNVWNATLLERGLFSLLHFGEDTAVCVTKRDRSETEALVECEEREEVIHNIHIDRHKYPPSAASAPASLTN